MVTGPTITKVLCLVHVPFSVQYHLSKDVSETIKYKTRKRDILFVFIASVFLTFSLGAFTLPLGITMALTCYSAYLAIRIALEYNGTNGNKNELVMLMSQTIAVYLTPVIIGTLYYKTNPIYLFIIVLSLIIGACVYTYSVPEKWQPGKFDFFGSSHQLMHFTLIVAHIA